MIGLRLTSSFIVVNRIVSKTANQIYLDQPLFGSVVRLQVHIYDLGDHDGLYQEEVGWSAIDTSFHLSKAYLEKMLLTI